MGASGEGETEYGRLRAEACTITHHDPVSIPQEMIRVQEMLGGLGRDGRTDEGHEIKME